MADDVAVLREILQRELETINTYEDMITRLKDPGLRQIVEHITDEEREHVAEMYQLIVERDPRQQALTERSLQHVSGLAAAPASQEAPAPGTGSASSVGSLTGGAEAPAPDGGGDGGGERLPAAPTYPAKVDLIPPPPPVFPTGAWSVGPLKQRK
jgi:hypothetical protein